MAMVVPTIKGDDHQYALHAGLVPTSCVRQHMLKKAEFQLYKKVSVFLFQHGIQLNMLVHIGDMWMNATSCLPMCSLCAKL